MRLFFCLKDLSLDGPSGQLRGLFLRYFIPNCARCELDLVVGMVVEVVVDVLIGRTSVLFIDGTDASSGVWKSGKGTIP